MTRQVDLATTEPRLVHRPRVELNLAADDGVEAEEQLRDATEHRDPDNLYGGVVVSWDEH